MAIKEIKLIIEAFDQAQKEGHKTALATVVQVEGSSYRAPGARMLIRDDGMLTGAVSGGCLEGDALRKALMVIMQDKPLLVTYHTTDDEDAALGVVLGCNGTIRVLIEPIHHEYPQNPIMLLKSVIEEKSPVVIVTLFSLENNRDDKQGTFLLLKENFDNGQIVPPLLKENYDRLLSDHAGKFINDARHVFETAHSVFITYKQNQSATLTAILEERGASQIVVIARSEERATKQSHRPSGDCFIPPNAQIPPNGIRNDGATIRDAPEESTVFFEYIKPAISLVIAGAGNDIIPVVKMAEWLGWSVTLIDGRPNYANARRFPNCQVMVVAPEKALLDNIITNRTACLLMSHNYQYDKAMLRRLSEYQTPYIGILGPKKKYEKMLQELIAEGISYSPDQLSNIYSPVGLDVGAETPEEIACAVIAEIKMVFTGGEGKSLRTFPGKIHQREITINDK